MKQILIITSLALFLSGCASPYQPDGFAGGYSDMALSKNTYQVSFNGNGYSSQE